EGAAEERDRATVGAAIEAVTQSGGWQLPATPLPREDAAALLACAASKQPWDCIPARPRTVRRMFVVGVECRVHEGAPMVVLTGQVIVVSERLRVVGERYGESCTGSALGEAAAELTTRLLREVAVRSGLGERLLPDAGDSRPARPALVQRRRSQLPPALIVSGGAALLVVGMVLLAFDEDSHAAGQRLSGTGDFDSARPGVGCALAGGALAVGGAYWWMRRARSRSAPTVTATSTGGAVGWITSF
ncbi:MAG TPA: hypothetical protein VNO30_50710, partial [Kofleriaceae bacterium]|nr:hypothetical protein [Kofleriaceae bacterium]